MQTSTANVLLSEALSRQLASAPESLLDVAILGSVSGHYGWSESRLVDADVWLYVTDRKSRDVLSWLRELSTHVQAGLANTTVNLKYEARAIDGPYKPSPSAGLESFLLHILVDDPQSYSIRSELTRFSWRKYKPVRDPELLLHLSPGKPELDLVVSSRWGLDDSIAFCTSGVVSMPELQLDSGQFRQLRFECPSFVFREACTYAVMMTARNIARVDSHLEPDTLPNLEFARWYEETYDDPFVSSVAAIKRETAQGRPDRIETNDLREEVLKWCAKTRSALLGR